MSRLELEKEVKDNQNLIGKVAKSKNNNQEYLIRKIIVEDETVKAKLQVSQFQVL